MQVSRRFRSKPQQNQEEAHGLFKLVGRYSLGGVFLTLEVLPDDWFEVGDNEADEATLEANIQDQKARAETADKAVTKFFVTISRRTAFDVSTSRVALSSLPIALKCVCWVGWKIKISIPFAEHARGRCWLRMGRTIALSPAPLLPLHRRPVWPKRMV